MKRLDGTGMAPHHFLAGGREDGPILVPLAVGRKAAQEIVQFCRLICPGAPIVAPVIDAAIDRHDGQPAETRDGLEYRIAALIEQAGPSYGLTLMPVVVIGHAEGATLAAGLALRCGAHLSACVLLRPTRAVAVQAGASLNGLGVLLCQSSGQDEKESAAARLRDGMQAAGAEVVFETVTPRRGPGGADAAICRVFLSALFTPFAPPAGNP